MRRYWILLILLFFTLLINAQDTPTIPVGLSDPYLMFVPTGWGTTSDTPFGFVTASNADVTLNVLDPSRFEQYIPYNPDTSARRLLIDYWRFFYVETIDRAQIDLLTIGDNTVAVYPDPNNPALATYIVELTNQRFALIEVIATDGTYDETEQTVVHRILGTLSLSATGEIRSDVAYESVALPSDAYTLSLPPDWIIEPSLAPGQVFLVGDGLETILLAPDTIAAYFDFPPEVNLSELAQIIETEFFDLDLTNIDIAQTQIGDRRLVAYGFRNINNGTDTQIVIVQLPNGEVAYYRTTALQDTITPVLRDRLRRIALSIQPRLPDDTDIFGEDIRANVVPSSGEWRVTPRDMMRLVCDGDSVEQLIPLTDQIRALFSDFDTIVADPDGESITIASDGVASLFQRGTLQREESDSFQILEENIGYNITPQTEDVMTGRLNIVAPNENGVNCRFGVSLTLRFVE